MIRMQRPFIQTIFLLCFFFLAFTAYSQPGDPGQDPDIPMTGIEWLLLGGGVWGAKKIYDLKKKVK